jgi:hypothetical protein
MALRCCSDALANNLCEFSLILPKKGSIRPASHERSLQCWIPSPERISEMARSDITLNMMLDQATQIVDTSRWIIVGASSEFWIVDPSIEPTERNNWGAVFNGIPTRLEAEELILNYNTPEEQAWRLETVRRDQR